MGWTHACKLGDFPENEGVQVDLTSSGCPVLALFKIDDEILAIDDACTHDESSLAEGYLDGDVVECSWHFAKFSMRTGDVLSPPATEPVRTWNTRVDGEDVLVETPD